MKKLIAYLLIFLSHLSPVYAQDEELHPVCAAVANVPLTTFSQIEVTKIIDEGENPDKIAIIPIFESKSYSAPGIIISEQQTNMSFVVPPLPARGEEYVFSAVQLSETSELEYLCKDMPVNMSRHTIKKGGYLELIDSVEGLAFSGNSLSNEAGFELFPEEMMEYVNQLNEDAAADYYFADENMQFRLDGIAAAFLHHGIDLVDLTKQTKDLHQDIQLNKFMRGDLRFDPNSLKPAPLQYAAVTQHRNDVSSGIYNSRLFDSQLPNPEHKIIAQNNGAVAKAWADIMCPDNGRDLIILSKKGSLGNIHSHQDVNKYYTAAQITAQLSAGLAGLHFAGSKGAEASSGAVGTAFTMYSMKQDFLGGMLPTLFVRMETEKENYPIYEDSGAYPVVQIKKVTITTRTRGWDVSKAGWDWAWNAASVISKSPSSVITDKVMKAGKFSSEIEKGLAEVLFSTGVGGWEGVGLSKLYNGMDPSAKFPPVECKTDITKSPYSKFNLLGGNSFASLPEKSDLHLIGLKAGSHPYLLHPSIDLVLNNIPNPWPTKELEIPELEVEFEGPSEIKYGESATYKITLINSDPKAKTQINAYHQSLLPIMGEQLDANTYRLDTSDLTSDLVGGSCRDRAVSLKVRLSGEFLRESNLDARTFTRDVHLKTDETNEGCEEDTKKEYVAGIILDPTPRAGLLNVPQDKGFFCFFNTQANYTIDGNIIEAAAEWCFEKEPGIDYSMSPTDYGFVFSRHGENSTDVEYAYLGRRYEDVRENLLTYNATVPPIPMPPMSLLRQLGHAEEIYKKNPELYELITERTAVGGHPWQYVLKHRNIYYFMDVLDKDNGLAFAGRFPYCDSNCRRNEEIPPVIHPIAEELRKKGQEQPEEESKKQPAPLSGKADEQGPQSDDPGREPTPLNPNGGGSSGVSGGEVVSVSHKVLGDAGMRLILRQPSAEQLYAELIIVSKSLADCNKLARQITIIEKICQVMNDNNEYTFSLMGQSNQLNENKLWVSSFVAENIDLNFDAQVWSLGNQARLYIESNGGRGGQIYLAGTSEMYDRVANSLPN